MGSEPLSEIKDFIWTRGFQDPNLGGASASTNKNILSWHGTLFQLELCGTCAEHVPQILG